MRLQIASTAARGRSTTLTAERLVNMYAERAPAGSEGPVVLHGAPGLVLHADTTDGPCRGLCAVAGVLFAVCGQSLYRIDSGGGVTGPLGTVPGSAAVSMATDGDILVIVTNPDAYTWTVSTSTFAQITDANYGGAHSVIWMNQTFIFASATEHFLGATGGLLPFDALMAASAEYAPDDITGIARDHNELLIYGESTLEAWTQIDVTDATTYPFDPISGAVGEKGLAGPRAIAQLDNTTVWLDQHGIVRRLSQGYTPQRISTEAIEHQLAGATLATATMAVYILEGHECFALNTDAGTFVYDANTGLWHERASLGSSMWDANCSAWCYGAWYVGSAVDGTISRLDLDTNDEQGVELVASMVFPPIVSERNRFSVHAVELAMDVGTGTLTDECIVTLYTSTDGETWSNGAQATAGLTGDRRKRVRWTRLGQWDKLHLRFDISDPYKRAVYAAYAEITQDDQ